MEVVPEGVLPSATFRPSPNQDERPDGVAVDLLVLHNISLPPGEFGGPWIDDLFHNRLAPGEHPYFAKIVDLKVSTHLLIRRDGELIQYVPFGRRAWHAGASRHEEREQCNDFSIGIELEGVDDLPYTKEQYRVLAEAIHKISKEYPVITPSRIVGHNDIAPERKTDPGPAFDWQHLHTLLTEG